MTASSRPWASVVIPIKDERDNLVPLTEQLLKVLGAREESRTSASTGSIVMTMDGDLQYDPADITTLLPLIRTYDLVCGWRINRHDNLMRKISSWVANIVQSAVTGDRVHDTGCSLKIFRRAVVDRITLFNGMHRFFPALALMHGLTVVEVPVRHYPRAHGVSKYGVGNRLFKGIYDLFAVRWMQARVLRYKYRDK